MGLRAMMHVLKLTDIFLILTECTKVVVAILKTNHTYSRIMIFFIVRPNDPYLVSQRGEPELVLSDLVPPFRGLVGDREVLREGHACRVAVGEVPETGFQKVIFLHKYE